MRYKTYIKIDRYSFESIKIDAFVNGFQGD